MISIESITLPLICTYMGYYYQMKTENVSELYNHKFQSKYAYRYKCLYKFNTTPGN